MTLRHVLLVFLGAAWAALPVARANAQMTVQVPVHPAEEIIQLEAAQTHIDFTLLGRLHITNGHFALKRGTIRIDPASGNAGGEIVIDAASENSNEDLRDAITRHAVLEVDRYPDIIFSPQKIQGVRGSHDDFYGEMWGLMQLHGGVHQMGVPLHGRMSGDQLTAACEFLVPYAEWGLDSPNSLSSGQIIDSTRHSGSGFVAGVFPVFAYLMPALRKIPPDLFWVSDLVDVKVKTQGRVLWAPAPAARTITVIVPPPAQVKTRASM